MDIFLTTLSWLLQLHVHTYSDSWDSMAAYDFQYVGKGLGAKDIAYLIIW